LPRAPVRALDPRRASGSRAHRRRRRAAHLRAGGPADAEAGAGDACDLHLHGGVERLHVAADRAGRTAAVHAAGRACGAVARAHHGRRDDDGRRGGHRAAGAVAVPGTAALVHAGAAHGQRKGLRGMCAVGVGSGKRWPVGRVGSVLPALAALAGWSMAMPAFAQEALTTRLLDGFDDPRAWSVVASDQVGAEIRAIDGEEGRALCLDYDFNGVSGHAGIQRALPLEYPGNYRFDLRLRGEAPANDLQFKLGDASGDNVWWVNRIDQEPPSRWTPVHYKARHIVKAWGPDPDPVLRASAKLEFVVYNRVGGRGSVCFDELVFSELAPADDSRLAATALGTAGDAAAIVDGDPASAWRAPAATGGQRLVLDLGSVREFGGLVL